MSKILIDGRFIGVGESMTRYTLEILDRILKLDKSNQYTLLIRPMGKKEIEKWGLLSKESATAKNLQIETLDIPHYSKSEQTKLLRYLNQKKFDLVHFIQFNHPVFYRRPYIITIHDLTLFGHLHRQNILKQIGFNLVMKSAVQNSQKIITISETSKKDIIENYKIPPEKIVVTHLAVDEKFKPELKKETSKIDAFKKKYKIGESYFLYTGMWKSHKNLLRLFDAYEMFLDDQKEQAKLPSLVLVGKIDKEEPEVLAKIKKINTSEKYKKMPAPPIITTGFIDEEELPISYAGALAYIIPSLSEGFGLPPLEAMSCGTPVLSSNISAMPEILGSAPRYFNPYDIGDIKNALQEVFQNQNLQRELSLAGLDQAQKYSWQKTAQQTLSAYKQVL